MGTSSHRGIRSRRKHPKSSSVKLTNKQRARTYFTGIDKGVAFIYIIDSPETRPTSTIPPRIQDRQHRKHPHTYRPYQLPLTTTSYSYRRLYFDVH